MSGREIRIHWPTTEDIRPDNLQKDMTTDVERTLLGLQERAERLRQYELERDRLYHEARLRAEYSRRWTPSWLSATSPTIEWSIRPETYGEWLASVVKDIFDI